MQASNNPVFYIWSGLPSNLGKSFQNRGFVLTVKEFLYLLALFRPVSCRVLTNFILKHKFCPTLMLPVADSFFTPFLLVQSLSRRNYVLPSCWRSWLAPHIGPLERILPPLWSAVAAGHKYRITRPHVVLQPLRTSPEQQGFTHIYLSDISFSPESQKASQVCKSQSSLLNGNWKQSQLWFSCFVVGSRQAFL